MRPSLPRRACAALLAATVLNACMSYHALSPNDLPPGAIARARFSAPRSVVLERRAAEPLACPVSLLEGKVAAAASDTLRLEPLLRARLAPPADSRCRNPHSARFVPGERDEVEVRYFNVLRTLGLAALVYLAFASIVFASEGPY